MGEGSDRRGTTAVQRWQLAPVGSVGSRQLLGARSPRAARSRTTSGSGSPDVVPHLASRMHRAPSWCRESTVPMGNGCQPWGSSGDLGHSTEWGQGRCGFDSWKRGPVGSGGSRELLGAQCTGEAECGTTSGESEPTRDGGRANSRSLRRSRTELVSGRNGTNGERLPAVGVSRIRRIRQRGVILHNSRMGSDEADWRRTC